MSRFIRLGSGDVLDEELVRSVMVANARYACKGASGRNQGDDVFEEVVEGRQRSAGYSSCADLVHWCLRRAGFRDERVLNREDDDGNQPWRVAVNVSRLVYATGHAFKWWLPGTPSGLRPGDMALIGEHGQEHVFIVADVFGDTVTSYDYGQWFNGKHGGKAVTRRMHLGPSNRIHFYSTTLPGRPFIGRLDPVELLEAAFIHQDLEAAEVPDDFEGGSPASERPSLPAFLSTREIQTALVELGCNPGPIDGVWGPKTRAAVKEFQGKLGLVVDGIVGPETREALSEEMARW